jgi:hypothetical protein
MAVQIIEIINRSIQGVTRPFYCRGEDGYAYFVKGHGAGRHSLIAEYICGRLASAFGLPVPAFEIVDVPRELIKWGCIDGANDLGGGLAFGSRALPHVQEFTVALLPDVDTQLRKDILVFDWWIRNADRNLTEKGGNPNLLWNQEACKLAVIDHNQAFDPGFSAHGFSQTHVFHKDIPAVFDDLVERVSYQDRLAQAFAELEHACDNVPPEWWWVDDGVPADFDRVAARVTLERYLSNDFWKIA